LNDSSESAAFQIGWAPLWSDVAKRGGALAVKEYLLDDAEHQDIKVLLRGLAVGAPQPPMPYPADREAISRTALLGQLSTYYIVNLPPRLEACSRNAT